MCQQTHRMLFDSRNNDQLIYIYQLIYKTKTQTQENSLHYSPTISVHGYKSENTLIFGLICPFHVRSQWKISSILIKTPNHSEKILRTRPYHFIRILLDYILLESNKLTLIAVLNDTGFSSILLAYKHCVAWKNEGFYVIY